MGTRFKLFAVDPKNLGALARAEVMYRVLDITMCISRYIKKSSEFSFSAICWTGYMYGDSMST